MPTQQQSALVDITLALPRVVHFLGIAWALNLLVFLIFDLVLLILIFLGTRRGPNVKRKIDEHVPMRCRGSKQPAVMRVQ